MALLMETYPQNQKLENLLNLSLDSTAGERERSPELNTGYDSDLSQWDLIIKYSGSLERVQELSAEVVELQNEYAIVTIEQDRIETLASLEEVEYVEKPKRLFFETENGRRVSCIQSVQDTRFSLFGQGILIGIIDSGIAFENQDFRKPDGTTRIRNLWDQSLKPAGETGPPKGYALGVEFTEEMINEALASENERLMRERIPSVDSSGHGTAVAGVAAGNGRNSGGRFAGVAPDSELIVVKLGRARADGFPRTTELMQGLDYVIRKAAEYRMPVAVNISFGNTYGSHDGTSLLERFIDDMANLWKSCICIGTGNEASAAGHTSGVLTAKQDKEIQLGIQDRQPSLSIQIWKEFVDVVEISLISPAGIRIGPIQEILGPQRFTAGQTEILLYYGEPSPFSTSQEIYIDMIPAGDYIGAGVWKIILSPKKIVSGRYDLWLPSENVLNPGTGFLYPVSSTTLTIPATSARTIGVGAYNARTFAYADFSGRGYTRDLRIIKPDLVAPGVDITTVTVGGGYAQFTGTSFAAPFVTGAAALLMEWGIIRGNDPYLYGEKVKAYLQRGAKPLPGFTKYPNPQVGYGALCLRDSLDQNS